MSKIILFFIALLTLLAFYFSPELVKWLEVSTSIPFDAFAALASAFAFIGMIYTISLQAKELKLQREDLKLTRQEMQETREEIKGQKEAMERQNVDRIFSMLIETHERSYQHSKDINISASYSLINKLTDFEEMSLVKNNKNWNRDFYNAYGITLMSVCNIVDFIYLNYHREADQIGVKTVFNSVVDPRLQKVFEDELYYEIADEAYKDKDNEHPIFYKLYERRDLIKEYLSLEVPE